MNKEGAIAGMLTGIVFTALYIIYFKFIFPESNTSEHWLFGISPEGIGALGMFLNFAVASVVMTFTARPPKEIKDLVNDIRVPEES